MFGKFGWFPDGFCIPIPCESQREAMWLRQSPSTACWKDEVELEAQNRSMWTCVWHCLVQKAHGFQPTDMIVFLTSNMGKLVSMIGWRHQMGNFKSIPLMAHFHSFPGSMTRFFWKKLQASTGSVPPPQRPQQIATDPSRPDPHVWSTNNTCLI